MTVFVTQHMQELGILVVGYGGWFEEHVKAKWKHTDATGLPDARKKRPSFSAPGKEEGGGHVDISLHLEPTMDIWDKTGAKVDTLFLPATFYRHIARNTKRWWPVLQIMANWVPPTHPVKKYNVNSSHYYLIANYWILP